MFNSELQSQELLCSFLPPFDMYFPIEWNSGISECTHPGTSVAGPVSCWQAYRVPAREMEWCGRVSLLHRPGKAGGFGVRKEIFPSGKPKTVPMVRASTPFHAVSSLPGLHLFRRGLTPPTCPGSLLFRSEPPQHRNLTVCQKGKSE